jgi:two-component system, OmpR family, phosphate regulon sensor histidine kinase PhoR
MKPEQRLAEQALLNEARLEALLKLSQMTEAPLQEITDFSLEQAVLLTKSQIGYLAFMNEDETVLTMHSWSKSAMRECAIADKPLV